MRRNAAVAAKAFFENPPMAKWFTSTLGKAAFAQVLPFVDLYGPRLIATDLTGLSEAAGRYGDLQDRSKSDDPALIGSRASTGFPAPDLFDHFAHAIRRLLTLPFTSFDPPYGCPLSPSGGRSWIPIIFIVCHHCPDRSGHLVRQSNGEPMPPKSHSFMADIDATFVQKILDIAKGQRETNVHHNRQADDLSARFETAKWIRFGHPTRLRNRPARLKLVSSDSAGARFHLNFPLRSLPEAPRGSRVVCQLGAFGTVGAQQLGIRVLVHANAWRAYP